MVTLIAQLSSTMTYWHKMHGLNLLSFDYKMSKLSQHIIVVVFLVLRSLKSSQENKYSIP